MADVLPFKRPEKKTTGEQKGALTEEESVAAQFAAQEEANKQLQKRLEEARKKNNANVTREYRLK